MLQNAASVGAAANSPITVTDTPADRQPPLSLLTLTEVAAILSAHGRRYTYNDLYNRLVMRVRRPDIGIHFIPGRRTVNGVSVPVACIQRSDLPRLAAHLGVTLPEDPTS